MSFDLAVAMVVIIMFVVFAVLGMPIVAAAVSGVSVGCLLYVIQFVVDVMRDRK